MKKNQSLTLLITISVGCLVGALALKLGRSEAVKSVSQEIGSKAQTHESLTKLDSALSHAQLSGTAKSGPINTAPLAAESPAKNKPEEKTEQGLTTRMLSESEQKSAAALVEVFSAVKGVNLSATDFAHSLGKVGLHPMMSKDHNSETGTLEVVRTQNTLDGTRYLHAQFFSDDKGESVLQHLSFELRPGPNSFQTAIQIVQDKFGDQIHLSANEPGFKAWKTKDGYLVWVKTLTQEDLKNDVINAHSPRDVGTTRLVMEQDIHGEESFAHGK